MADGTDPYASLREWDPMPEDVRRILADVDRLREAAGPFARMNEVLAIATGFNYSMVRNLRRALDGSD